MGPHCLGLLKVGPGARKLPLEALRRRLLRDGVCLSGGQVQGTGVSRVLREFDSDEPVVQLVEKDEVKEVTDVVRPVKEEIEEELFHETLRQLHPRLHR